MALPPLHLLTLCDGYGGTELALRSVARVRTVCRVERDAYAAAVLVARMEEQRLDQAPIWDDVDTFDGTTWRGRVDIVAAGFPCQPFSAAGQRAGVDDDRWLWPDIERIIGDVRPRWVLLENVPQLVRHGLPEVLGGLASLGFDAEWALYSAAAVGAPHKRERVWIVAHADRGGQSLIGRQPRHNGHAWHDVDGCDGALGDVGHPGGPRRPEVPRSTPGDEGTDGWWPCNGDQSHRASEDVADTASVGRDARQRSSAWRRWTVPETSDRPWPPGPDDHAGWLDYIIASGPQPVVRRSADGPPVGLADALHLGGNGLVPQCAAEAWSQLIERGGWLT